MERLWPGARSPIEVLGGGITNRNVKVTLDEGPTWCGRGRTPGSSASTAEWNTRPRSPLQPSAWGQRWSPSSSRGLPRHPVRRRRGRASRGDPRAGGVRRSTVAARDPQRTPDRGPLRLVPRRGGVPGDGVRARGRRPAGATNGRVRSRVASARPRPAADRLCHNDLLTANFIDDGIRIRIVDWEYAATGDVFFDLANFAVNHELSRAQTAGLLARLLG